MKRIREVIVVEGRDDITAVKRAVEAEVFAVHGFGVHRTRILEEIRQAHERTGVIVLTDPDWAGERIRKTITSHVPEVKHAFIAREAGTRLSDGNIGVENASPEVIREALEQARCQHFEASELFGPHDLMMAGLVGHPDATKRRHRVGEILGVGQANAKQFLRRLNHFQISYEEFDAAMEELEK